MIEADSRARDFPTLAGRTYLNTAAESLPPVAVGAALEEYWGHKGLGMRGRDAHFERLNACREVAARMVGLAPGEVSFCSCSSEAYNLLANALDLEVGDEVVISDLDFPAGATPWMGARDGVSTRLWQSVDGALKLDDLAPLLSGKTRLVQVSLVSFLNGYRLPWRPFHDAVRELAPNALISVDVTQALGRIELDCAGFDCLISSTHKWALGIHGGCVVGIPERSADRLTTGGGGWFHLENAFDADRFQRVVRKRGAASFSVGMPNFAAIYALNAGLRYLEGVGVNAIATHADPLISRLHEGLRSLGLRPMAPEQSPGECSGIVAFQHPESQRIHQALEAAEIHIMQHAGRLRVSAHGYNTLADVERFLEVLGQTLED